MDEFNFRRSHVPAFGSWDCNDDLPFTQCFESARQAGLLRYSYSEDRDLYVAGDLYENDVVTPAMIVVPRHRGKAGYAKEKEEKKDGWVVCDCDCELKAPQSPVSASPTPYRPAPKAVDEDLYKISPDLLHAQAKRMVYCSWPINEQVRCTYFKSSVLDVTRSFNGRVQSTKLKRSFFSSCLRPDCLC